MLPTCANHCAYAKDAECDDGGSGAEYDRCSLGSDCTDCGLRAAVGASPPAMPALCSNSCNYAKDGECDDGGDSAEFSGRCPYASDCAE